MPALAEIDIRRVGRNRFRLQTEQHLARSREEVFAFFADAHNLERVTPPWLHFRILTPPPIEMRAGLLIDYRLRLRGVPLRWRSEITAWEPPHRFVDEQRSGPYLSWVHEHTFAEAGAGTLVRDRVDYGVPGGATVNRLFVAPDLRKIFTYRQERMAGLLAPSAGR